MTRPDAELLEAGGVAHVEKRLPGNHVLHLVELTREKALNALLPQTFQALHAILDIATPPCTLLIRGRGRAFSAGGDVRALRTKVLSAGDVNSDARCAAARDTLKIEYDFLERLAGLRGSGVVSVAVCDGYAFGAGMGLFEACAVRLVSEKAVFSMPEVKIGLVPDCGATMYYARMPGCVGMYAALTGCRIAAGDAVALGLADGAVEAGWCGDGLAAGEDGALKSATARLGGTELGAADSGKRRMIDEWFSAESVDEVVARVRASGDPFAEEVMVGMTAGSPRALRECFAAMREGYQGGGLGEAVARELRIDSELSSRWDFEEGVRALLVDKDNAPKWEALEKAG